MKLLLLSLLTALLATVASAQTVKEIDLAFNQKKYEQAMAAAQQLMAKEPANAYPYGIIGGIYVRVAKYDSSLLYLQKALALDNDSTSLSGWVHTNLGNAYIYLNEKDKGVAELKRAIELDYASNSARTAKKILDSIDYDLPAIDYSKGYLPSWVAIESADIIYKFQDTAHLRSQVYRFINRHEQAYKELTQFFEPKLPLKMTMHVWNDNNIAKKILPHSLGFASPKQCFCHLYKNQSQGHEMTHILAYWSWGSANTGASRFTNEGIAVCFDLEDYDKYARARNVIAKYKIKGVMQIWENEKDYDEDVLYPIAGAFINFLKQNSTTEQFKQVVKQQTIDNVKVIYGSQFNKLVTDFNNLMGMKA